MVLPLLSFSSLFIQYMADGCRPLGQRTGLPVVSPRILPNYHCKSLLRMLGKYSSCRSPIRFSFQITPFYAFDLSSSIDCNRPLLSYRTRTGLRLWRQPSLFIDNILIDSSAMSLPCADLSWRLPAEPSANYFQNGLYRK